MHPVVLHHWEHPFRFQQLPSVRRQRPIDIEQRCAECVSQIIIIQSTSFTVQHLAEAVDAFLSTFWERLSTLPQSEFDEQVCLFYSAMTSNRI